MKQTYYRITTESGSLYEIDLADDGTGMWRRNGEGRQELKCYRLYDNYWLTGTPTYDLDFGCGKFMSIEATGPKRLGRHYKTTMIVEVNKAYYPPSNY